MPRRLPKPRYQAKVPQRCVALERRNQGLLVPCQLDYLSHDRHHTYCMQALCGASARVSFALSCCINGAIISLFRFSAKDFIDRLLSPNNHLSNLPLFVCQFIFVIMPRFPNLGYLATLMWKPWLRGQFGGIGLQAGGNSGWKNCMWIHAGLDPGAPVPRNPLAWVRILLGKPSQD